MIRKWIDSLLGYKDLYYAEREWSTALNEKLLEVEKEKAELEKEIGKILEEGSPWPYRENKSK